MSTYEKIGEASTELEKARQDYMLAMGLHESAEAAEEESAEIILMDTARKYKEIEAKLAELEDQAKNEVEQDRIEAMREQLLRTRFEAEGLDQQIEQLDATIRALTETASEAKMPKEIADEVPNRVAKARVQYFFMSLLAEEAARQAAENYARDDEALISELWRRALASHKYELETVHPVVARAKRFVSHREPPQSSVN
ncbi:MAG TPA: hypothetical protein VJB98_01075 [Candidatus Paceibacterota bacterium]